jgi:hypothetical protein
VGKGLVLFLNNNHVRKRELNKKIPAQEGSKDLAKRDW